MEGVNIVAYGSVLALGHNVFGNLLEHRATHAAATTRTGFAHTYYTGVFGIFYGEEACKGYQIFTHVTGLLHSGGTCFTSYAEVWRTCLAAQSVADYPAQTFGNVAYSLWAAHMFLDGTGRYILYHLTIASDVGHYARPHHTSTVGNTIVEGSQADWGHHGGVAYAH